MNTYVCAEFTIRIFTYLHYSHYQNTDTPITLRELTISHCLSYPLSHLSTPTISIPCWPDDNPLVRTLSPTSTCGYSSVCSIRLKSNDDMGAAASLLFPRTPRIAVRTLFIRLTRSRVLQFGKDGWCARKLFSSFWNCARENRLVRGKTLKAKMAAQSARGAKILRIPISLITTPLCTYLVMLSARESKMKWRFAPYPYLTNSSHWYLSHDSKLSWKCNLVDDAEWNYTTYCHLYHGWRKGSSV